MKLLVFVLDKVENLEPVLNKFEHIGIRGATILELSLIHIWLTPKGAGPLGLFTLLAWVRRSRQLAGACKRNAFRFATPSAVSYCGPDGRAAVNCRVLMPVSYTHLIRQPPSDTGRRFLYRGHHKAVVSAGMP